MKKEVEAAQNVEVASDYVAPQIEKVITPEDLEREVHYAGAAQDGASLGPA
jgi:hypothetical protein